MTRFVSLLAVLFAIGAMASVADAAAPSPDRTAGREILGVVPVHGQASRTTSAGSNLSWHGGPVVRGDRTYAIYWQPSTAWYMSPTYSSLIDGFLGNVASANAGKSSADTYFNDTQYYDGSGNVSFSGSAFGGSVVDSNPFPASGCSDSVAATSICLSDSQMRTEIANVIRANGWTPNGNTIFFMFTPKGVGSCYSSSSCAFSSYCAYHSSFSTGGGTALYANQPYTGTAPSACGSGQSPNADPDADSTISVVSHEHNEAITDPLGTAWYDRRGYEDADKCAWNFGSNPSGSAGAYYNQSIGTGRYYVQQNWSNKSSGCVLGGL